MAENTVPGGHIVGRDGDLGEVHDIPTPEQFAEQAGDARQGAAISDQVPADEQTHAEAYDAAGWDEATDANQVNRD